MIIINEYQLQNSSKVVSQLILTVTRFLETPSSIIPFLEMFPLKRVAPNPLSKKSGIYILYNPSGNKLYIGQGKSLSQRKADHTRNIKRFINSNTGLEKRFKLNRKPL